MGARDQFDAEDPKLYVQRLRMVDGAYASDGTYWGGWSDKHGGMWCGFNDSARVYVRAKSRAAAVQSIRESYPDAVFYKGA